MRGNRPCVHEEPLASFTDDEIALAYARGKAWIQRNYREWPYGHSLLYQIKTHGDQSFVSFFFVPEDDDIIIDDDDDPFEEIWCI